MNAPIGHKLVKVQRLAWNQADDLTVGPVHLIFDDGRGLFLGGRSDWSLDLVDTLPGDDAWLATYDNDFDGGRWLLRDASAERPFVSVVARRLVELQPILNDVDEVFGVRLEFDGHTLALRMWQGEITT